MPDNKYNLILEPKLSSVKVNETKLKTDLAQLRRNVNKDSPLLLSLGVDIAQSVSRMSADLRKIKPQLENSFKLSLSLDTSSLKTSSLGDNEKLSEFRKEIQQTANDINIAEKAGQNFCDRVTNICKIVDSPAYRVICT